MQGWVLLFGASLPIYIATTQKLCKNGELCKNGVPTAGKLCKTPLFIPEYEKIPQLLISSI